MWKARCCSAEQWPEDSNWTVECHENNLVLEQKYTCPDTGNECYRRIGLPEEMAKAVAEFLNERRKDRI